MKIPSSWGGWVKIYEKLTTFALAVNEWVRQAGNFRISVPGSGSHVNSSVKSAQSARLSHFCEASMHVPSPHLKPSHAGQFGFFIALNTFGICLEQRRNMSGRGRKTKENHTSTSRRCNHDVTAASTSASRFLLLPRKRGFLKKNVLFKFHLFHVSLFRSLLEQSAIPATSWFTIFDLNTVVEINFYLTLRNSGKPKSVFIGF